MANQPSVEYIFFGFTSAGIFIEIIWCIHSCGTGILQNHQLCMAGLCLAHSPCVVAESDKIRFAILGPTNWACDCM